MLLHDQQVDYTGFSTVNSQKFGQRFVGKVANPHDMLLWTKAAQRKYVPACLPALPACLPAPLAERTMAMQTSQLRGGGSAFLLGGLLRPATALQAVA